MSNSKNRLIGVYTVCDSISIYIHGLDYVENKFLASANGIEPKWYPMTEKENMDTGEAEEGFLFEDFFVPLSEKLYMS